MVQDDGVVRFHFLNVNLPPFTFLSISNINVVHIQNKITVLTILMTADALNA